MQLLDDRLIPRLLWLLQALFLCRVIGQILVQFWGLEFLPPSSEWYSGVVAYTPLLFFQLTILGLQTWVNVNFTQQAGFFTHRSQRFGKALLVFGTIYLLVMVTRYVVRMSLYPLERWTGGSIPIFFHWVLASYCIAWGLHTISLLRHQRTRPFVLPSRRLRRTAWAAISLVLISCFLAWTSYLVAPAFLVWKIAGRAPLHAVRIEARQSFETVDGVRLVADVYHPIRAGAKSPTILVRLNYTKTAKQTLFARLIGRGWAEQGFTVVLQGTRGRYQSEGEYVPFQYERRDGQETLSWLSQQPWFNGTVGTWGALISAIRSGQSRTMSRPSYRPCTFMNRVQISFVRYTEAARSDFNQRCGGLTPSILRVLKTSRPNSSRAERTVSRCLRQMIDPSQT